MPTVLYWEYMGVLYSEDDPPDILVERLHEAIEKILLE